MRDPERIRPTLDAIEEVWKKHPDLRLGQLICILTARTMPTVAHETDPFYIEDEELVRIAGDV